MNGKKLAPLAGVLGVALIVVSFIIAGESPSPTDSVGEVVSYYHDHDTDLMWASALLALGAFFMFIFTTTVAGALRRASGEVGGASAVSFGGGVMLAIGIALFAGVTFALADAIDDIEPAAAQALNVLSGDLFFPLAIGNAAFLLGSGIGILKTTVLPSWLGWVAIVVGIAAITPAGFFAFMVLGVWTLVVSVMLYGRVETA